MKTQLVLIIIMFVLLTACGQTAETTLDLQSSRTPASALDHIPTISPTADPTPTRAPSETPTLPPPTNTSEPTPSATAENTPTPDIPRELVAVAYDDRIIRGTMLGDGETAVILAPMFGLSRSDWMPFAKHIVPLGYTALAIDFPGIGASTGNFSFTKVNDDIVAVVDYLLERGITRIVCMGASLGAGACFQAAVMRPELVGLVVIAAPPETTEEQSAGLLMPKLFLVGGEPDVKKDMDEVFALLPLPKEFKTINYPAHGTDLLHTESAEEFQDTLFEFLESLP